MTQTARVHTRTRQHTACAREILVHVVHNECHVRGALNEPEWQRKVLQVIDGRILDAFDERVHACSVARCFQRVPVPPPQANSVGATTSQATT